MNENIKKDRLLFEIARKQHAMKPDEVFVGKNAIAGSKLAAGRETFSYNRSMDEVAIGKEMLNGNNLAVSVTNVIKKSYQHEESLTF